MLLRTALVLIKTHCRLCMKYWSIVKAGRLIPLMTCALWRHDTRLRGQNNKRRKGTFQLLLVISLSIKCESDKYVYCWCVYIFIYNSSCHVRTPKCNCGTHHAFSRMYIYSDWDCFCRNAVGSSHFLKCPTLFLWCDAVWLNLTGLPAFW